MNYLKNMFSLSVHRDITVVCALKMDFNTFPFWIFKKICDSITELEEWQWILALKITFVKFVFEKFKQRWCWKLF